MGNNGRKIKTAFAICLAPVILYFILYGLVLGHTYWVLKQVQNAGPVAWTGSLQHLYVSGTDEQAIPALEVMIRHRIPFVLSFFPESKITDRSLRVVGRMTWLHELYLAEHSITDEGLDELENLDELTYLELAGTLVTDEGIQTLTALASLRHLGVLRTRVTADGLERLVRKMPSLQTSYMEEQIARLRERAIRDAIDDDGQ